MKVVIIGGSAGGASVAARLRRQSESAEITLIEMSSTISFATCGIPYYLGGVISDRERLNVVDQDYFADFLNVDLRTHSEVIAIDRQRKKILIQNHSSGSIYEYSYDKLVLATGGKPFIPDVENINTQQNVFSLRTADDTDKAFNYIRENNCKDALIIGAGFIGLELAENLHNRGITVTVLDKATRIMGVCDAEMTTMLHRQLEAKGINVLLENTLTSLSPNRAELADGQSLNADIVFVCTGIKPNVRYAQACKLTIGRHGGISVNQHLQTSDDDIYALGDAVEVQNIITKEYVLKPFAGIAQKQARIVADNICGLHKVFNPVQGTAIIKIFDLAIGITGLSEQQCKSANLNYKKTYVEATSHAGFYPDAHPLIIKLLFYPLTGRILGAQIVGAQGVDKRIDVIASAIQFERTIYDLASLELAYAPQFSSAKDPVNVAAMTAVNMMDHDYAITHWHDMETKVRHGAILLDIRLEEEYELQHLDDAINIPLEQLRTRHGELPGNREIIVYCRHGKKGYFAERLLKKLGFIQVSNLCGGQNIYQLATLSPGNKNKAPETAVVNNVVQLRHALQDKQHTDTSTDIPKNIISIDATGIDCPDVLASLAHEIKKCRHKELLKITVSSLPIVQNIKSWADDTGNSVTGINAQQGKISVFVQPGNATPLASDRVEYRQRVTDFQPFSDRMTNNPDLPDISFDQAPARPINSMSEATLSHTSSNILTVDTCGLSCPGPIMKLSKTALKAIEGDMIHITATDSNFANDISTWSNKKGFRVITLENNASIITAVLQKIQTDTPESSRAP